MKKILDLKDASSTKIALIIMALYGLILMITYMAW